MLGPMRIAAAVGLSILVSGCIASAAAPDASARCYIVELTAAPLVSYAGGVENLAPTRPRAPGAAGVDPSAPASQAYLRYLKEQQGKLIATMADILGRPVPPVYSYYYALDGFAVRLTSAEAARVAGIPGVSSVRVDKAYPVLAPDGPLPAKPPSD